MSSCTVDYIKLAEERRRTLEAQAAERAAALAEYLRAQEDCMGMVRYTAQVLSGTIDETGRKHPSLHDVCRETVRMIDQEADSIVSSFFDGIQAMTPDTSHEAYMGMIHTAMESVQKLASFEQVLTRIRAGAAKENLSLIDAYISRFDSIGEVMALQSRAVSFSQDTMDRLGAISASDQSRYDYLKTQATLLLNGELLKDREMQLRALLKKADQGNDFTDTLDRLATQISAAREDARLYREVKAYALQTGGSVSEFSKIESREHLLADLNTFKESALTRAQASYIQQSINQVLSELGYRHSSRWFLDVVDCTVHTASPSDHDGLRVQQTNDQLFIEPVYIDRSSASVGRRNSGELAGDRIIQSVLIEQNAYCSKRDDIKEKLNALGVLINELYVKPAGGKCSELKVRTVAPEAAPKESHIEMVPEEKGKENQRELDLYLLQQ